MTVAVKQFLGGINRRFVGRRKLTCVFKAFRQLDVKYPEGCCSATSLHGPRRTGINNITAGVGAGSSFKVIKASNP